MHGVDVYIIDVWWLHVACWYLNCVIRKLKTILYNIWYESGAKCPRKWLPLQSPSGFAMCFSNSWVSMRWSLKELAKKLQTYALGNSDHQDYYIFSRDSCKPSFTTVTVRGPHPTYAYSVCRLCSIFQQWWPIPPEASDVIMCITFPPSETQQSSCPIGVWSVHVGSPLSWSELP